MTDDNDFDLAENVLAFVAEGLGRLLHGDQGPEHCRAFLSGETVFVVGREAIEVRVIPPEDRRDLGTLN